MEGFFDSPGVPQETEDMFKDYLKAISRRCARGSLPRRSTGSPINFAGRLIGSPIAWRCAAQELPEARALLGLVDLGVLAPVPVCGALRVPNRPAAHPVAPASFESASNFLRPGP